MLDWLKKKPHAGPIGVRDTLFGDMPFGQWPSAPSDSEPWVSFVRARDYVESGDKNSAATTLQGILKTPQLESRHYLQAYQFLRDLGIASPQGEEKRILGVVVEVGMNGGTDLVAGYADQHARYYNYSGAAVVWERPNDSLDDAIDKLLQAGSTVAMVIGRWEAARPAAPANGHARINFLTPSGLHFGEGPLNNLAKDQLGGPVVAAAFELMQRLIKLTKK